MTNTAEAEVEVIDPLNEYKEQASCFGQFDANYTECTQDCALSAPCKRAREQAPQPAPPAPALEENTPFPEMEPHDFLIESIKGRYTIKPKSETNLLLYKDENPVAQVTWTSDKRYLIRTANATLQLNSLESVRHASEVFKAILIV